jgi:hypothetical protein
MRNGLQWLRVSAFVAALLAVPASKAAPILIAVDTSSLANVVATAAHEAERIGDPVRTV